MISAIIPTRNRGDAFKRSLDSLLNQTIAVEIVVSDHASTDGTAEYVQQFPNVVYARWPDEINITQNWHLGYTISQGEWIKYCFDDDYLEPECCEKMLALVETDTTVVQCGATFAWTGQSVYDTWTPNIPIPTAVRSGVLSVSPVTALIRRDALQEAWDAMPLLSQRAYDSGVGPNVLINYLTVAAHPKRMAYTSEILCHLDDLPGEHRSLTAHLRDTDPETLFGCHEEAYRLIEQL
jgi:glycosyltransferase involved in cell wall biosynthesis